MISKNNFHLLVEYLFISVERWKFGLQVNSINRATAFENIGPSVDLRRRRKQKNCFSWARQKSPLFPFLLKSFNGSRLEK